jgi:glucose-6-phosphate 1-dehydrogenase
VHLRFETKVPDTLAESRSANMDFSYREAFPDIALPDAYERLLLDALKGDASLFARSDGIEIAWGLLDPLMTGWLATPEVSPLRAYARKTWGPAEAHELLARDGHEWRLGCGEEGCLL